MNYVWYFLLSLVCGTIGALVAKHKGMPPALGFLIGFCLSVIGVYLITLFRKKKKEKEDDEE